MERVAIDCQTALWSGVRPQTRVVGWAYGERIHVAACFNKFFLKTVEQFHLLHRVGAFTRYVVEEDGKCAYAQVIHQVEFVHEVLVVFLVPFDVLSRVDSPNKVDVVTATCIHKVFDLTSLFFGIWFAPVWATVIGSSFGP